MMTQPTTTSDEDAKYSENHMYAVFKLLLTAERERIYWRRLAYISLCAAYAALIYILTTL